MVKGVHPLESNTQSGELPHTYEVVCRIPVYASSPERAAAVARDIMLDPDSMVGVNVHKIEFYEPADDYLPDHENGWLARFGYLKYNWSKDRLGMCWEERVYSTKPDYCVGWSRGKS